MKANPITNANGNKKQMNVYTDKAKKTGRETLTNKPPTNVTGINKPTKLPEDKLKIRKYEMNLNNKNNGISGPATSTYKKNKDTFSKQNIIFKAHGKTEKRKPFSNTQGPKEVPIKKNIGRFKNNTKLKGTTLQLNLQQNSQQKALGSNSVNKCNFRARSLKNSRTFHSGIIEGLKKIVTLMKVKCILKRKI